MDKNILKQAAVSSLATAAYVTIVGVFMSYADNVFGKEDNAFTPVAMLMLLVLSAAITGSLLFSKPIAWYIDGQKKQALQLLGITLTFFAVITLLAMFALAAL